MSNSTKRLMRNQRVDRVLEGQYMKKKGAKAAKRAATLQLLTDALTLKQKDHNDQSIKMIDEETEELIDGVFTRMELKS